MVAGAQRQDSGLDSVPIEPLDRQDASYIDQIVRSTPVEQRHDLPGHDLVEIENENAPRPNAAENTRLHADCAEQRLARHVVQVELQRRVTTERGRVAREPLASQRAR